ncbi:nuclear transport factor 2 family protein [Spirosoma aerolatum]|uniref:nuclear transport factor 2 family protein n=1 Tax=Spirosoma aerolatum TaxID=1211326 RepID=UPI0009ACD517|nr:nuclear transport factor 2 family protein [Spirosoma aerolatum]
MKTSNLVFLMARLLTLLLLPAFAATTLAQGLNPEAVAFTKTYQTAYNKGDRPTLMTLFADNVGWVNPDGSVTPGSKADVEADYVRDFGETAGSYMDFAVVSTEAQPDGKVKIGTTVSGYDFVRKTGAKLNPTAGTYEMLIGKVGGQWKISQVKWTMNTIGLEMRDLMKRFQDAYNREDVATLKMMFTADAVRTATDGTTTKGAAIVDFYTQGFVDADVTNVISLASVSPQFDGSVIFTGTYHLTGRSAKGERIVREGAYSNTAVKENGQWKISRNTQSKLVKTVVYHKVADYVAWKKGFDLFYNERMLAGELSAEVSTLADDPNTVCIISEWASPDAPKAFFARPDLAETMRKDGVIGKPTMLIMSKE